MNDINRFFRPVNSEMEIPDCDYNKTEICTAMAKALARNTNHSLYIIDYNRKNFFFMYPPIRCFFAAALRKKCNKKGMPSISKLFRLTR